MSREAAKLRAPPEYMADVVLWLLTDEVGNRRVMPVDGGGLLITP